MTVPRVESHALREWERIAAGPVAARPRHRRAGAWLLAVVRLAAKVVVVALLPFLALVRTAVYLYEREHTPVVLALLGGIACTTAIVALYGAWLSHRLTGRMRFSLIARRIALPVALSFCGYALLYLSSAHAKSDRVQAYYLSLHPLLRVALSTVILIDHDLMVTDLARRPADYAAMGLPVRDGSLHFIQADGYAHAADLRTAGRGELTNRLVQVYFWSMGFATLRHMGTADHLHVELPLP
jgi:hypothetical protein